MSIHEHSKLAHSEVVKSKAHLTIQGRIIHCLSKHQGCSMTDREIKEELELDDRNMVRPRVTQMKKDGILYECGSIRCHRTGKTVRLVKLLSEAGV